MLITFKSKASGDVIMFGDVGEHMLRIIGKNPADQRGVVTVEQLPDAIQRLRQASSENKMRTAGADEPEYEEVSGGGKRSYVSLTHRALPLIELFEYSLKAKMPVMWGV